MRTIGHPPVLSVRALRAFSEAIGVEFSDAVTSNLVLSYIVTREYMSDNPSKTPLLRPSQPPYAGEDMSDNPSKRGHMRNLSTTPVTIPMKGSVAAVTTAVTPAITGSAWRPSPIFVGNTTIAPRTNRNPAMD